MIGIYEVKNLKKDKSYIVSALNVEHSMSELLNQLKGGVHQHKELQHDWTACNGCDFDINMIKECDKKYLSAMAWYYTNRSNNNY